MSRCVDVYPGRPLLVARGARSLGEGRSSDDCADSHDGKKRFHGSSPIRDGQPCCISVWIDHLCGDAAADIHNMGRRRKRTTKLVFRKLNSALMAAGLGIRPEWSDDEIVAAHE